MISLSAYHNIPMIGFAAYSGTGKTTLLEQLLPLLNKQGIRVAMIKHTHHDKFDIDQPGKDSYRLRKAGAQQMLVASSKRWALMVEQSDDHQQAHPEPNLHELLAHLDLQKADLILVEGFKHETISKIELHRPILGKPLLCPNDPNIIAIATDQENLAQDYPQIQSCPILNINDIEAICTFICEQIRDFNLSQH